LWPFAVRLEDLQARDITRLVDDRIRESSTIEFKREMYGGSDAEIRELLRDILSMANADGGVILIGIEEDGEGAARAIVPQGDAEKQAMRVMSSCLANCAERIPGLQARPVPVPDGEVIVVRVPRSYRKPHMITFGGATDFWIRHDRQKSRMSIAEVRAAISATENLEMKAATYIEERRRATRAMVPSGDVLFTMFGTPLSLTPGVVDVSAEDVRRLLSHPPSYRARGGVTLSDNGARLRPSMAGVRALVRDVARLEIFRSGHVEFVLFDNEYLFRTLAQDRRVVLVPWMIAEFLRNFAFFIARLRLVTALTDPYLLTISLWNARNLELAERHLGRFAGYSEPNPFTDDDHLLFEPLPMTMEEGPDTTAQRLCDRFWNAFGFESCPFFDEGKFFIPPS